MSRNERAEMARQTVEICNSGMYTAANGARALIGPELAAAKTGTKIYTPETTGAIAAKGGATRITVRNETTFAAIARLSGSKDHVACLNFASAKNPGGGFLNGALAQEEALAAASGLYPCLLQAPEYYERNRAHRSTLYLDIAIYSPLVPFFRDDSGKLLEKPVFASVITAPAPNAGAIAQNEPANLGHVEPTLRRRAELVLAVAANENTHRLILGAWGCGVFRNDPNLVAKVFADLLAGSYRGVFHEVVFAVFDRSQDQRTYSAFDAMFNPAHV